VCSAVHEEAGDVLDLLGELRGVGALEGANAVRLQPMRPPQALHGAQARSRRQLWPWRGRSNAWGHRARTKPGMTAVKSASAHSFANGFINCGHERMAQGGLSNSTTSAGTLLPYLLSESRATTGGRRCIKRRTTFAPMRPRGQ
jgi:hypothetical protein